MLTKKNNVAFFLEISVNEPSSFFFSLLQKKNQVCFFSYQNTFFARTVEYRINLKNKLKIGMKQVQSYSMFMYTVDESQTSKPQALLWHNTGPLPRGLSSHYLVSHIIKCVAFFQIEGWWDPRDWSVPYKIRLMSILALKFTSKWRFPTWAPLPTRKKLAFLHIQSSNNTL